MIIPAAEEYRMDESVEAMNILGAGVIFVERINFFPADVVYAPAIEGGHPDHDAMGKLAVKLWGDWVVFYSTYRGTGDLQPKGKVKVSAAPEMEAKKLKALECYKSQIVRWPEIFALKCKDEYYV